MTINKTDDSKNADQVIALETILSDQKDSTNGVADAILLLLENTPPGSMLNQDVAVLELITNLASRDFCPDLSPIQLLKITKAVLNSKPQVTDVAAHARWMSAYSQLSLRFSKLSVSKSLQGEDFKKRIASWLASATEGETPFLISILNEVAAFIITSDEAAFIKRAINVVNEFAPETYDGEVAISRLGSQTDLAKLSDFNVSIKELQAKAPKLNPVSGTPYDAAKNTLAAFYSKSSGFQSNDLPKLHAEDTTPADPNGQAQNTP